MQKSLHENGKKWQKVTKLAEGDERRSILWPRLKNFLRSPVTVQNEQHNSAQLHTTRSSWAILRHTHWPTLLECTRAFEFSSQKTDVHGRFFEILHANDVCAPLDHSGMQVLALHRHALLVCYQPVCRDACSVLSDCIHVDAARLITTEHNADLRPVCVTFMLE